MTGPGRPDPGAARGAAHGAAGGADHGAAGDAPVATADTAAILAARARALARPLAPTVGAAGTDVPEVVVLGVARERWAVEARHVLAVFALRDLTPLPGAAPPIVGLTAWRGLVLTLADLRALAGGSAAGLDDLGRVVVLGDDAPVVGVLADRVDEVVRLPLAALRPVPAGRTAAAGLLRGVAADGLLLLDAAALLASLDDRVPAAAGAPLSLPPAP